MTIGSTTPAHALSLHAGTYLPAALATTPILIPPSVIAVEPVELPADGSDVNNGDDGEVS